MLELEYTIRCVFAKEVSLLNQLHKRSYPSFVKYMGSKTKLMAFLLEGINATHDGEGVLDLFAGSASLAGAIGNQVGVISNDIQAYSGVLADAYTTVHAYDGMPAAELLVSKAEEYARDSLALVPNLKSYDEQISLQEFNAREAKQRDLIYKDFTNTHHLFVKNYSGTWWSAEQAVHIDALRQVADEYKSEPIYTGIMSCIMFAMAYTSIGTGHYAQYRDAKTDSSMADIKSYRRKPLLPIFKRKYAEMCDWLPPAKSSFPHKSLKLDYEVAIQEAPRSLVYADPPYCFVHYSRFYHALETLVLYDYPSLQVQAGSVVKGRYREERHQSPFCIKSKVPHAFKTLFDAVADTDSKLVMSYSNTGMIGVETLLEMAAASLPKRKIELITTDYQHMTLGRYKDRVRDVKECLLLVK